MEQQKLIYFPTPKVTKDSITLYGAGKFKEASLKLNKSQACLLYLELHKFINSFQEHSQEEQIK